MNEKFGRGVSCNSILLIKHFAWHTLWNHTLIYEKVGKDCWASVINVKFERGESVSKKILRDILTWHTSM